jgi:hypothetical protein
MARYALVWSDVPRDQYDSLPPEVQAQVDATLDRLQDDPEKYGTFDKAADQWSATFGDGSGFVLYVISRAEVKVVLLRIISI